MDLKIADTVAVTEAEGPGKRFALWLQGCPLDCPGCCNPEMIPFEGGQNLPVSDLTDRVLASLSEEKIEGITIMGGEPFSQVEGLAQLVEDLQVHGLSVMIFSGYQLEELRGRNCEFTNRILTQTDILVDGRYDATLPDTNRRWIGSKNQNIHFFSDRYSEQDAYWAEPDTLELRWQNGELSLNGFPAKSLSAIWAGNRWQSSKQNEKSQP